MNTNMLRGGNGSDADRIVLFPYPFSYLKNKYGCEYGYCQIQMRSGCYSNTNTDRMFFQYETDMNNKIIDLYLIVSQPYNDIIHNSLKFNHKKNTFDHFASFLN
jgi:hypothetical protein